jgi:hypothetical protein
MILSNLLNNARYTIINISKSKTYSLVKEIKKILFAYSSLSYSVFTAILNL